MLSRRSFSAMAVSAAFAGFGASACMAERSAPRIARGYGALQPDPNGLLDLPKSFSYRIISAAGDAMDDGWSVPDRADGMGSFALGGSKLALVRNHEMRPKDLATNPWPSDRNMGPETSYDRMRDGRALPGSTTTLIYDMSSGRVEQQYLSLAGTIRNCAGGTTPWGSWLTCEEDVTRAGGDIGKDHGWVFEVPSLGKGLATPEPLRALGRFNHEAVVVDPRTGIVYLTEDEKDGLFYRLLPTAKGNLMKGGKLQALGLRNAPEGGDSRNWFGRQFAAQVPNKVVWIDLEGVDNPHNDLRLRGANLGACMFARGEGVHLGSDEIYFTCTSGGAAESGQIMRYRPSVAEGQAGETDNPGTLDLFFESRGRFESEYADNLIVAPHGHILLCEDQSNDQGPVDNHIRGLTPTGQIYPFARLRTQTEMAGLCFSPDGTTMFVNIYQPGKTLAITGPWASVKA